MKDWKWRQFLLLWLLVFCISPSYGQSNLFSTGPHISGFQAFGGKLYLELVFGQFNPFDPIGITDSLIILLSFTSFTFIVSAFIYFVFLVVRPLVLRSNPDGGVFREIKSSFNLAVHNWSLAKLNLLALISGAVLLALGPVIDNSGSLLAGIGLCFIGVLLSIYSALNHMIRKSGRVES